MTDYTVTTNFGAKDSLPSGNAGKVIKGFEFTTEFTNIQTAIATKADTAGDTFTGAVTFDAAVTLNADVTFNTNTMFVDVSANRVGINTTNPQAPLHVHGDINLGNSAGADAAHVEIASLNFYNRDTSGSAPNNAAIIRAYSHLGTGEGGYLTFATSDGTEAEGADATEKMWITSAGKVGIGTDSPSTELAVEGDVTIRGTFPTLFFSDTNSQPDYYISAGNGYFQIYDNTNDTDRFYIDSGGRVGIGTDSPESKLEINGGTSGTNLDVLRLTTDSTFSVNCSDLSQGNPVWTLRAGAGDTLAFGEGTDETMRITSTGNVLVGRTSANASDEQDGIVLSPTGYIYSALPMSLPGTHIAFINNTNTSATTVGTIRSSGATTSYNTSSDERLKENITDSADAGSKVDAIQIRQFDWKVDGSHQDYGVIAQELINVAPEAVSEGETEEDMMGVDYSKLVPMLVKEVQSLRSRVAELENV